MGLTERLRLLPLSMPSKSLSPLSGRRGFCQRPRPNKYSGRQLRPSKRAALAIQPPNCSPSLWKRFPNLSRHLGSKAIEEDRSYGHYTIFGTRPDIAALRLLSVQLLANSSIVGQTRARNSRMGSARWRHAIWHLQALANT